MSFQQGYVRGMESMNSEAFYCYKDLLKLAAKALNLRPRSSKFLYWS